MTGCARAPSTRGRVVRAWGGALWGVVIGMMLLVAVLSPEVTVIGQVGSLVLVVAAVVLHLVVHEAAHATTALAMRMGVPEVEIGDGPALFRFRIGSTTVKVGGFHAGATLLEPESATLL